MSDAPPHNTRAAETVAALADVDRFSDMWGLIDEQETVGALLAVAVDAAADAWGFDRGLVVDLDVEGRCLQARSTDPLTRSASETLRHRLVEEPARVDAVLARRLHDGDSRAVEQAAGLLAAHLSLHHWVALPLTLEGSVSGLVILDRAADPILEREQARCRYLVAYLGQRLLQLALARRLGGMAAGMEDLMTTMVTLGREAAKPTARGDDGQELNTGLLATLTPRETEIAILLCRGLSNREIAGTLSVAAETVKGNVRRILHKLGAANRVEAVSILMQGDDDRRR